MPYNVVADREITIRVKIGAQSKEALEEAFDQLEKNLTRAANRSYFTVRKQGNYTERAHVIKATRVYRQ